MKFAWQQIPSPTVSEILCMGFDGVVLDTEHGVFSTEQLMSCMYAIQGKRKEAWVRICEPYHLLSWAWNFAFDGVIFADAKVDICKIIESVGIGYDRSNGWGTYKSCHTTAMAQIERPGAIGINGYNYYMLTPLDFAARSVDMHADLLSFLATYEPAQRARHDLEGKPMLYDADWMAYSTDTVMLREAVKKCV